MSGKPRSTRLTGNPEAEGGRLGQGRSAGQDLPLVVPSWSSLRLRAWGRRGDGQKGWRRLDMYLAGEGRLVQSTGEALHDSPPARTTRDR